MLGLGQRLTKPQRENILLGPELVTNGKFDTDLTSWTNTNTWWVVSSGRAYHAASLGYNGLISEVILEDTKTYKISFDCEVIAETAKILQASNSATITTFTTTDTRISLTWTATDNTAISFSRDAGSTAEFYIDNVSVKEVFSQYGPELVTNGGFDTDTDWTKGTGWSISGGQAVFNTAANSSLINSPIDSFVTVNTSSYRVRIEGTITSGSIKLSANNGLGSEQGITFTNGVWEQIVVPTDATEDGINIRTIGAAEGTIVSISVKEVL